MPVAEWWDDLGHFNCVVNVPGIFLSLLLSPSSSFDPPHPHNVYTFPDI